MAASKIPEGTQTLTPYLVVDDAARAIDFYRRVFGAELMYRMDGPDGRVAYASVRFGDSQIMLSDVFPEAPYQPPKHHPPSAGMYLYVEDVDAAFQRAVEAGATSQAAPDDMFWGDRWCRLADPFGQVWELATHVEDVPPEELGERAKAAMT
jgi:PhnB protein